MSTIRRPGTANPWISEIRANVVNTTCRGQSAGPARQSGREMDLLQLDPSRHDGAAGTVDPQPQAAVGNPWHPLDHKLAPRQLPPTMSS